jgi:hypothetical protein
MTLKPIPDQPGRYLDTETGKVFTVTPPKVKHYGDLGAQRAPQHHAVKCILPYFEAAISGKKTFEIRKNDRDYCEGDTITLREYEISPTNEPRYTGREAPFTIGYVFSKNDLGRNLGFALPSDVVVFSLISETNCCRSLHSCTPCRHGQIEG